MSKPADALKWGRRIGFPLIIKAAFGGGGRGMRVVHKEEDLKSMLEEAQGEAERAFGNPAVFLERYVGRAKHLEVQILGDQMIVFIFMKRDCSVQRRYQKVVEVAPSIGLDQKVVDELCQVGVDLATKIGYNNAGTVEFLLDQDTNEWFFIEMNPRFRLSTPKLNRLLELISFDPRFWLQWVTRYMARKLEFLIRVKFLGMGVRFSAE